MLNAQYVFSLPSRLVLAPTQNGMAGGVYPYGSTSPLGYLERAKHVIEEETFEVISEARGRRVAGGRGISKSSFVFVLTQFDPTGLNNLYAVTTVSEGGFSGANTLDLPDIGASQQPGLVAPGAQVLVAPEDPSRPALLIYAPRWSHGGKKEVDYALDKGREEGVVLFADDDASGRDFAIDLMQNLSV